jgi:hypothetical protein
MQTIPQYTVSLSLCLVTLCFSHIIINLHFQLHLPSSSYPEKELVKLSFGHHYANLLTKSLGFLELFLNSPLSVFGHLSRGPASRLTTMRTI